MWDFSELIDSLRLSHVVADVEVCSARQDIDVDPFQNLPQPPNTTLFRLILSAIFRLNFESAGKILKVQHFFPLFGH